MDGDKLGQNSSGRGPLEGRAALPGAFYATHEASASSELSATHTMDDSMKASDDQLMEIARMRLEQKNRLPDEDPGPPVEEAAAPIQSFQNSMSMLQDDVVTEEREHQEKVKERRYSREFWAAMVITLLLAGGAIAGIVVGLGGVGRNNENTAPAPVDGNSPLDAGNESDDVVPHVTLSDCAVGGGGEMTERYEHLRAIILSEAPDMEFDIDSPGSRARIALCWLADYDTLQLHGNVTTGEDAYDLIQRFTLVSMYYHFVNAKNKYGSDNDLVDTNWLSEGIHECAWDFLTCAVDNETSTMARVVTTIKLTRMQLEAAIPIELILLTKLEHLDISDNLFSGPLPLMPQLKTLNLDLNFFSGSLDFLGQMKNLRDFRAAANRFAGELPDIGKLTNLESFRLLNMRVVGSLPADVSGLTNLNTLDLVSLALTGTIPASLGALTSLETLTLAINQLGGAIPSEIGLLSNVEELVLRGNKFISTLPTELGKLTSLTNLKLGDLRRVTGMVPTELGLLTSLENLDLDSFQLTGAIPIELCDLRDNGTLTTLETGCNLECSCCKDC